MSNITKCTSHASANTRVHDLGSLTSRKLRVKIAGGRRQDYKHNIKPRANSSMTRTKIQKHIDRVDG